MPMVKLFNGLGKTLFPDLPLAWGWVLPFHMARVQLGQVPTGQWGPWLTGYIHRLTRGAAIVGNFVPHPSRGTPRLIGDIPG